MIKKRKKEKKKKKKKRKKREEKKKKKKKKKKRKKKEKKREEKVKSVYFNHPFQGNSANYYIILGPRDKAAPPISQQKKVNFLRSG